MRKLIAALALFHVGLGFVACSSSDSGSADACHDGCVKTMAADCENGPATQEQCESDCKSLSGGKCASDYSALQSCGSGKQVTCDADGQPTVPGCESQETAFVTCLLKP